MISAFNVLIVCYYGLAVQFLPKQAVSVSNQFYTRLYYDGDGTRRTNKICHHMYGPRADLTGASMWDLDGPFYTSPPSPNPEPGESFSPSRDFLW